MSYRLPCNVLEVSCCVESIDFLEEVLNSPAKRRDLLSQGDRLVPILNCQFARRWLQEQACQPSDRTRSALARALIVELMQYSQTLWRGGNPPPDPEVYEEALSRTWQWFFNHLCTAYNPEVSSFTTWFNSKLRYVIQDVWREVAKDQEMQVSSPVDDEAIAPIDRIPCPRNDDSILINDLLSLLQGKAAEPLRRSYMRNCSSITGQRLMVLILESLRQLPQIPWDQLAQDLTVDKKSLCQFYRSACLPRFRQLLEESDAL